MNSKETAQEILSFINKLSNFWEDLQKVVIDKCAVIAEKAKTIYADVVETEDKFIDVIIEMLFIWKPTPAIFKPLIRWILKPFIKFLLKKIDSNWLQKIKDRMQKVLLSGTSVSFAKPV